MTLTQLFLPSSYRSSPNKAHQCSWFRQTSPGNRCRHHISTRDGHTSLNCSWTRPSGTDGLLKTQDTKGLDKGMQTEEEVTSYGIQHMTKGFLTNGLATRTTMALITIVPTVILQVALVGEWNAGPWFMAAELSVGITHGCRCYKKEGRGRIPRHKSATLECQQLVWNKLLALNMNSPDTHGSSSHHSCPRSRCHYHTARCYWCNSHSSIGTGWRDRCFLVHSRREEAGEKPAQTKIN